VSNDRRDPREVAIVGAGVSGLGMAAKLDRAGIPYTIFERAQDIGGTWRVNTYPGLVCDVPVAVYTYSFDRNPSFPRFLATGEELLRDVERICANQGLRDRIRFGADIDEARWLGDRWRLREAGGAEHEFRAVVQATGFLREPRIPEIPGLESFAGSAFHSSRWDHDVQLEGRRVGVIGSGSTGVQILTALAGQASQVAMFQRTAQWIFPLENFEIPRRLRTILERHSRLAELWVEFNTRAIGDWFLGPAAIRPGFQRRLFGWLVRRNLRSVKDPDLRARLTPNYQPLCKRPVMSGSFYDALQRPDTELVDTAIERVAPEGIVTADGRLHELDVIAFATGFDAHAYVQPMRVIGEDGMTIEDAWANGPAAYRTVAISGFPNMFLMLGPHTPLINVPVHYSAELQADFAIRLLKLLERDGAHSVAPTQAAMARWMGEIREGMTDTVWASGCRSWYIGPDGVAVQWPFTRKRFAEMLNETIPADFEVRRGAPAPTDEPEPAPVRSGG
jgi:cation diffusion facilitator CzcD-associated flavoprotein CzcO